MGHLLNGRSAVLVHCAVEYQRRQNDKGVDVGQCGQNFQGSSI